jgi:YVTN family beta-propeller protein
MSEASVEGGRRLAFLTLGPLQVGRGDQLVALGGRQQRAVLAVLIVNRPAPLSVSRIADEIWGERVPAGYVRTIHTYVHHLRQALEPGSRTQGVAAPEVLTTVERGYQLVTDDDAIDAVKFERLVTSAHGQLRAGKAAEARHGLGRALAMWRGDVLADLIERPFAQVYASRLEQLRLTAIEGVVEARLALGEHATVVAELEDLVARHPLRETFRAQQMLALYRSGRQADALVAFRTLRQVLDDELGVEPSTPLRQLHQAVLTQDPAIAAPSVAPADTGSVSTPPSETVAARGRTTRRSRAIAAIIASVLAAGAVAAAYGAGHRAASGLTALPANSVGAIAANGTLRHAIAVGPDPSAIAYGAGTLWVTSSTDGRVTRLDSQTHRVVETIPVGRTPSAITLTARDAWVANAGDGTVSRINIDTNTAVQTITVGALPTTIAAGPSGVWVANSGDDSIQRIDPITGTAGRPIPVGARPDGIAVGALAVWVANGQDGTVTRIDPSSRHAIGRPIAVGSGPGAIAVTGDAVWVANLDDQSVVRIDPRTATVEARVPVGDGPSSVAVANGRVWVGNAYEGSVSELDAATNAVRHRFAIGASPRAIVAQGSSVWIASGAFAGAEHSGGTLTVTGPAVPGNAVGIDPSNAYLQSLTRQGLGLVYDGLVAYRVAGGSAGLTVVPDLATAVPRPSDGGRTYSFTLRRGVRYSDGTPVIASDIERGVLRSLTAATYPGGPASSVRIVGTRHCGEPHTVCDLSRGVVVDDTTGTVVFHLDRPDPDFLFKLAYFGQATVPGAPATEVKTPLPGTGPYRIAQYQQGETFVLTRNPHFHQWSYAAQPAGYPDTIRWVKRPNLAVATADVLAGRADLVRMSGGRGDAISQQVMDQIGQQYPAQLHSENAFALEWMYLNTRVPPFNDARARRAINDAVDRRRVVEMYGGSARAAPTCQMLPPDFPGYRRHCPYSTGPPAAPYAGPNLAEAHALVTASGSYGEPVTVTGPNDPVSHATNTYLVGVLRSLGYHAHLDELTQDRYFAMAPDPRARLQVVQATGWIADYPAASNFYLNVFACVTDAPGPGAFAGRGCELGLDALAEKAYQAEGTDPGAAHAIWAAVDRKLTDAAVILALVNPLEDTLVSHRVGNYQRSSGTGPLLSQLWVQ